MGFLLWKGSDVMVISSKVIETEKDYLKETITEIEGQLKELGKEINVKEEQLTEFKKFLWESKGSVDKVEMQTGLMSSELEANFMLMKMEYYKKLFRIQDNPYFGRIDFIEDDEERKVYIGLTHVSKGLDYFVYDWRSPIASMFYDYGTGPAKYEAPEGEIRGWVSLRRQYKINNKKLIRIFDNDMNVVDDCLQEVLSENSSDKMKNIVNTIQAEQNDVIRNTRNKHLIVQGIAGSGKTSVALHRIAFLLYKIKNLKSSNVLIFSPNNVFSEYISNVLPELGEENTMNTTFHDFALTYVKEFKKVEPFTDFIEKYYTKKQEAPSLVAFKLSKKMVNVIEDYVLQVSNKAFIKENVEIEGSTADSKYLNYLLKERYDKLPLFQRIEKIAEHLCDKFGISYGKKRTIIKQINNGLSVKRDFKKLYNEMFLSDSFKKAYKEPVTRYVKGDQINYEDALCFIYLKGLLEGFPYSNLIRQVVIDEAQDYNEMQYLILSKIFKRASFTVLGDVNQTINPYQRYDTLEVLTRVLSENSKYVELNKTYRSSKEIIAYANKLLGLNHVSAIRRENNVPVTFKTDLDELEADLKYLKTKYKSVALITKDKKVADYLYNLLKDKISGISIMQEKETFNKDFVIIPSYLAKGLEFDAVISYTSKEDCYTKKERYLFYVVCTRAQHELIIYNEPNQLF